MGGSGSGNHWRWDKRDTVEETIGLDVRYLARNGMLRPGRHSIHWSRGDRPSGSIGLWVTDAGPMPGAITLEYRERRAGGEWRDVSEGIALEWTDCHYGGSRPWLICPACGGRVAILYGGGVGFACRKCWRLVYQSQRETAGGRGLGKAQAIRRRLGGSANMTLPFPPKPPRMHWRTYWRLRREADAAEAVYDADLWAFLAKTDAWLARHQGERP